MARSYATDGPGTTVQRTVRSVGGPVGAIRRMSWGAVLAGVALTLVLQLLFSLLGIGLGLAAVDPAAVGAAGGPEDNPSATTISLTAGIYWVVTSLIAIYAGAWVAGRLAGMPNRTDGMLHGITAWSVATLLLFYLLTSTVGSLIGGAFNLVGSAAQSVAQGAQSLAGGVAQVLPDDLRAQAEALFERAPGAAQDTAQQAQQATGTASTADAVRRVVAGVREGAPPQDRQAAVNLIAQQAGIPPEEAQRRLDQFQNTYRQTAAQAEQTARETAQRAAETVSQGALWSVAALAIGLIAAAIGGRAGAPTDYDEQPLADAELGHTSTSTSYSRG
jgi:hypothetical protein